MSSALTSRIRVFPEFADNDFEANASRRKFETRLGLLFWT